MVWLHDKSFGNTSFQSYEQRQLKFLIGCIASIQKEGLLSNVEQISGSLYDSKLYPMLEVENDAVLKSQWFFHVG